MANGIESKVTEGFKKTIEDCKKIGLCLPTSFRKFFKNEGYWAFFRSYNGGFFDFTKPPIKYPCSNGYLIRFICDSQYCHFYYLYLEKGSLDHKILWAEDDVDWGLYASKNELEQEAATEGEIDFSKVHLVDNDFEHFMWAHYKKHEKLIKNVTNKSKGTPTT